MTGDTNTHQTLGCGSSKQYIVRRGVGAVSGDWMLRRRDPCQDLHPRFEPPGAYLCSYYFRTAGVACRPVLCSGFRSAEKLIVTHMEFSQQWNPNIHYANIDVSVSVSGFGKSARDPELP